MSSQHPIVIGIGGNVGTEAELVERFRRAREAIGMLGEPLRSAPLYRTAPIGPLQPPFLNTAVTFLDPARSPSSLIASLLDVEHRLGRTRDPADRFGPRRIDLDVLVWGTREIQTAELEVPHPRLGERRFALEPLAALLGPDFEVPALGRLAALLERVRAQQVDVISEQW